MVRKRIKNYKLTEKQIANIVVAARDKSKCPAAKKFVKKLDNKYKLPKNRR